MSDQVKEVKEVKEAKEAKEVPVEETKSAVEGGADKGPVEEAVEDKKRPIEEEGQKKKKKQRRRQYEDVPKEKSEDEKEDDDEEEDNDDNLDEDDDDLAEIDTTNIITTGRRTRGKVIDFNKAAEKLGQAVEDDEDDEFEEK